MINLIIVLVYVCYKQVELERGKLRHQLSQLAAGVEVWWSDYIWNEFVSVLDACIIYCHRGTLRQWLCAKNVVSFLRSQHKTPVTYKVTARMLTVFIEPFRWYRQGGAEAIENPSQWARRTGKSLKENLNLYFIYYLLLVPSCVYMTYGLF